MILLPVILSLPYVLILLWIFTRLNKARKFIPGKKPDVFVSVITACRNEENNLPVLLNCLSAQDYPKDLFEVIIVDDHSKDNTAGIVCGYSGISDLQLIKNEGHGKKEAIRTGILQAKAELILTTDADCSPGERWISTIASMYRNTKPDLIAGPVRLTAGKGFFGKFQELEFLSLQAITAGTILSGQGTMCNGANLAFKKSAWLNSEKDMRFDILTGDDVFLLHSLKKLNAKINWMESTDAIVETKAVPRLKSFLMQRKRWASKSTAYRDPFSVLLGIVTFVTNLLLAGSLLASCFNSSYFHLFALIFVLKSIPDFLLLNNAAGRYEKRNLLIWFLPSQLIYPFYVLIISVFALTARRMGGLGVWVSGVWVSW